MITVFRLYLLICQYFRSHEKLKDSTVERLTRILTPDVKLYNHFSSKLLKRLETVPPEFEDELNEFKDNKKEVCKCLL